MSMVPLSEAKANLDVLLANLAPGDELVIMKDNQPVGRLTRMGKSNVATTRSRTLGTLKGTVTHIAADFDAPLRDFSEYSQ